MAEDVQIDDIAMTRLPALIIIKDGFVVDNVIKAISSKTCEFLMPGLPSNIVEIVLVNEPMSNMKMDKAVQTIQSDSLSNKCILKLQDSQTAEPQELSDRQDWSETNGSSNSHKGQATLPQLNPLAVVEAVYDSDDSYNECRSVGRNSSRESSTDSEQVYSANIPPKSAVRSQTNKTYKSERTLKITSKSITSNRSHVEVTGHKQRSESKTLHETPRNILPTRQMRNLKAAQIDIDLLDSIGSPIKRRASLRLVQKVTGKVVLSKEMFKKVEIAGSKPRIKKGNRQPNESEIIPNQTNGDSASDTAKDEKSNATTETMSTKPLRSTEKQRICPICNQEVASRRQLNYHKRILHAEDKPFKCDQCDKSFKARYILNTHKKVHENTPGIPCKVCDKVMANYATLKSHMKRLHAENSKPFACPTCDKKFHARTELEQHQQSHEGGFMCEFCAKSFSQLHYFKRHVRLHTGELNSTDLKYKCDICGNISCSKKRLEEHRRVHTGEKPIECPTCGMKFRTTRILKRHSYTHSDVKRYKCNLCEKAFRTRQTLVDHQDRHNGIKRHTCEYCGQQFYAKVNMSKHLKRMHLDIKPHKCDMCDKRFVEKQELALHVKRHRNEEKKDVANRANARLRVKDSVEPVRSVADLIVFPDVYHSTECYNPHADLQLMTNNYS